MCLPSQLWTAQAKPCPYAWAATLPPLQMPAVTESSEQDLEGFEGVQPPDGTPEASPGLDERFKGPNGAVPSGAALKGYMGTIEVRLRSGVHGDHWGAAACGAATCLPVRACAL